MIRLYLWFCRVLFCCTRTMGAVGTRPSLRPLFFEGGSHNNSDALRAAGTRSLVFSFSPFLRGEGRDEGLSPRTEFAERAPHPKFAAQISTSPRIRLRPKAGFGGQESGGEVTSNTSCLAV